jgi:hypothetical protein
MRILWSLDMLCSLHSGITKLIIPQSQKLLTLCKLDGIDANQSWISAGGDVCLWPIAPVIALRRHV